MWLSLCQLIGGAILSVGVIPQIVQVIRTKKANDLNHVSILTVLAGISLMEIYAIGLLLQNVGTAFFITNTVSLLLQLALAVVVLKYKKILKRQNQLATVEKSVCRGMHFAEKNKKVRLGENAFLSSKEKREKMMKDVERIIGRANKLFKREESK